MFVIKLNAIDSTNTYLKNMVADTRVRDYTVVQTYKQLKGKGQRGAIWQSEPYKNLTVSVFKTVSFLKLEQQFYISIVTALAIYHALSELKISQLTIKWPNDILSANKKICGILIENIIKRNLLHGTVIGFGLNVNQTFFENLPQASSLKLLTGNDYNVDLVLNKIISQLTYFFEKLEAGNLETLLADYQSLMYRLDKPSTFKLPDNTLITGIIKGITSDGYLLLKTETDGLKTFENKTIRLMY